MYEKDLKDNFASVKPFARNSLFVTDVRLQIIVLCLRPLDVFYLLSLLSVVSIHFHAVLKSAQQTLETENFVSTSVNIKSALLCVTVNFYTFQSKSAFQRSEFILMLHSQNGSSCFVESRKSTKTRQQNLQKVCSNVICNIQYHFFP